MKLFIEIKNHKGEDIYINPFKIAAIEQDTTRKDYCGVLFEGLTKPMFIPLSAKEFVKQIEEQL